MFFNPINLCSTLSMLKETKKEFNKGIKPTRYGYVIIVIMYSNVTQYIKIIHITLTNPNQKV